MLKSILLIVVLALTSNVYGQEAAQILAQIRSEHAQRFNSGGFINDPALTARFSASQKSAVARLRAGGLLKRSFTIKNNLKSSLVITVGLVQETSGQFAGLLIEKSQYDSVQDEAQLRLFNIPILINGMPLFSYNGNTLVSIKSQQLTPEIGGQLTITYPTNLKNNTFGSANLNILKSAAGDMSFYTEARVAFSRIDVNLWVNIFTQNIGVQTLKFI